MQNGKGDKPRPYDINKYGSNFDEINWHRDNMNNYNAKADKERRICRTCRFLNGNYCKNIKSICNGNEIAEINKDLNFCSEWASKKVSLKK